MQKPSHLVASFLSASFRFVLRLVAVLFFVGPCVNVLVIMTGFQPPRFRCGPFGLTLGEANVWEFSRRVSEPELRGPPEKLTREESESGTSIEVHGYVDWELSVRAIRKTVTWRRWGFEYYSSPCIDVTNHDYSITRERRNIVLIEWYITIIPATIICLSPLGRWLWRRRKKRKSCPDSCTN